MAIGAVGGVGGMMATGAIPRPGNPYYIPRVDNPERILSSTPPGQAGYQVFGPTVPNLSPINLRTPPGFVDPQHEQRFSQAQPRRLVRNLENGLVNPEK